MMDRVRQACVAVATVLALATAALAQDGATCPAGWNTTFNANGPGCTFCANPEPGCESFCLGPPACLCQPGDTECCTTNPCCENCPNAGSLECNVSSCGCDPSSCCRTICPPQFAAPAIGTPTSLPFAGAAALLAIAGLWHITRRRRSHSS